MQKDFHYYATYCAAYLAGYTHSECLEICYSAQFVDLCSATLLSKLKAPREAATTQLQLELADANTDLIGIQNITRIWSSFHFLPRDLYAEKKGCSRRYLRKYRLICGPNGDLLIDTVNLAKGGSLQAAGVAMHVLADTWAHMYFAGTPSLVINNTNRYFTEIIEDENGVTERRVTFKHSRSARDDFENSVYTNSLYQASENSIMNLGHGRAGHIPDYSFIKYKYLPSWGDYEETVKDNREDYFKAFCQMLYALKYLKGEVESFEKETYDTDSVAPYESEIREILSKRQGEDGACLDWKAFGEKLSGEKIPDFDIDAYQSEYTDAPEHEKDATFLGKFFIAALRQKSMVTNKIFKSKNILAGISVDIKEKGFRGIKAYFALVEQKRKESRK